MRYLRTLLIVVLGSGMLLALPVEAVAQHDGGHAGMHTEAVLLAAPGQAIFGAVQEVIERVEADTSVGWSDVNLERLRQHLVDMHRVAVEVDVVYQHAIEGGVLLRVAPTSGAARASLGRVLRAHPAPIEHEAGWTMAVEPAGEGFDLRVTTTNADEVAKIRALGYIGLLAYGAHHQHHHWMIATGQ